MNIVQKGHEFIQERSCLHFREHDPVALARQTNITYLYYTFSEVLESCCLKFYNKPRGRRLVLITPLCKLPAQAGHATLHAMGLHHEKKFGFRDNEAKAVMFPDKCAQRIDALKIFEETLDDLSLQIHSNGR
ncbi:unnamed protein product [Diatraea saccharalis]|uniref:Peptidase M12A domain-containing protein n=1 Tax=Diatraea saccharalis TaxID=40085 RepID=A0A9N9R728_9NEOP|nr:unnamed protein product [Diatraea saccharalis]